MEGKVDGFFISKYLFKCIGNGSECECNFIIRNGKKSGYKYLSSINRYFCVVFIIWDGREL